MPRLQKVVNTEEPKARPPSAPTPKKAPKPSQEIPQQAHSYIFDFDQHMGKSLADVCAKDPSYIRLMQSLGVHYKYAALHYTLARCGTITLVLSEGGVPNPSACPRGWLQLRRRRSRRRSARPQTCSET